MKQGIINILISDKSEIVAHGISSILAQSGMSFGFKFCKEINEIDYCAQSFKPQIIIISSEIIKNREHELLKIKKNTKINNWILVNYGYSSPEIASDFNSVIYITDSADTIFDKINKAVHDSKTMHDNRKPLSDRETDVLKELIAGLSNKEIADKLNISIHTVVSHRKNITEKTGIKSLPGLTIYAISKRLTTI